MQNAMSIGCTEAALHPDKDLSDMNELFKWTSSGFVSDGKKLTPEIMNDILKRMKKEGFHFKVGLVHTNEEDCSHDNDEDSPAERSDSITAEEDDDEDDDDDDNEEDHNESQKSKEESEDGESGIEQHVCSECSKEFSSHSNMTRHYKTLHAGCKYICGNCNHKFSRTDALKYHQRICKPKNKW